MKLKILSGFAACVFTSISLQAQTVSTFAGSGEAGFQNGNLSTAQFSGLEQMAYDKNGNLLVCDALNNRIRKIDPAGNVTTFAGSGTAGLVNGNKALAQFNNPLGIAIDDNNNVYIGDNMNFVIRKIDNSGNVTTYAGSGKQGYTDSGGTAAAFGYIDYMCFDNAMNLYLADPDNSVIRKIDPQQQVSTFAGNGKPGMIDGIGQSAQLSFPIAITYDKINDVFFISDQGNSAVRKALPDGTISTYAGMGRAGYWNGPAVAARFDYPKGLTTDALGNVYVAGRFDYTIRKIDTQGDVSTVAGVPFTPGNKDGIGGNAVFGKPIDVILSPDGNLMVSDWGNKVLRKVEITAPIAASIKNRNLNTNGIEISPNPFSTSTLIKVSENKGTEPIIFSMFDISGKEVKAKNTVTGNQILVEKGNLSSGIYFYSLLQGFAVIGNGKLVIE